MKGSIIQAASMLLLVKAASMSGLDMRSHCASSSVRPTDANTLLAWKPLPPSRTGVGLGGGGGDGMDATGQVGRLFDLIREVGPQSHHGTPVAALEVPDVQGERLAQAARDGVEKGHRVARGADVELARGARLDHLD